jgi:hypothetical protein
MLYGRRAVTTAGLTWGYFGGTVLVAGVPTQIANGTVTLTASATNYIEADPADGSVSVNTTAFTAGRTQLYSVVVGASTVTSYTDLRTAAVTTGGATGTVTSVGLSAPGFLSVSGSPVTGSGTLALSYSGTALPVANGGTGGTSASAARTALGLAIGSDVQAYDAELAALAGLTSAADKGIQFTGSGTAATFDLTTAGKALLDDADAAAQRTTLGLGTVATLASDTDTSLSANSDSRVATQKAVKAYVDAIATSGAADVMIFKGVIDCSGNPNYPAADAGNLYKVSVAGKIGGGSGPNVEVGDTIYCITDSTASGNHATVGANWVIAQVNIDGAVTGPASATDGHLAVFDGATGKLIRDGGAAPTGTNTGDETTTSIGALINGATAKTTPVDADYVGLMDSAASNILKKLSWANIKATLKTYFDTLYAAFGEAVNAQTGTTYTYVNGDAGKLVTHTNGSAIAGTLPQAGSGGNFAANWWMDVQNRGAGTLTITPTTSTIDGAATLTFTTGQGARIVSDGTNYFTQRGGAGSSGGGGTPGGSTTQLQFNDGGSFGGDDGLTWDKTNNILYIGTTSTNGILQGSAPATTTSTGTSITIKGGSGGSTSGAGGGITIQAGDVPGSSNATGADVTITGGQAGGTSNAGRVVINGGAAAATAGSRGGSVLIKGANGTSTGTGSKGGDVTLTAGDTVGSIGTTSAGVFLNSGNGDAAGLSAGGPITLTAGNGGTNANGGTINLVAGTGGGTNGNAGPVNITAGDGGTSKNGGAVTITGGTAGSSNGVGGAVNINAGAATGGNGGAVNVTASAGVGTNKSGGDITLTPGAATGTGTPGNVVLNGSGSALSTSAKGGFTCLPTCAGTPTGTPGTVPTGCVPMVFDTTNSKFWIYTGGAWKGVVLS